MEEKEEILIKLKDGKSVRLVRKQSGKVYLKDETRKWDKSSSIYCLSVVFKALRPNVPILTFDVCRLLLDSFAEVMRTNGGSLDALYTNNVDTVILNLKIHRNLSPAKIVGTLKSSSSRFVKEDPKLKRKLTKYSESKSTKRYGKSFWGSGYDLVSFYLASPTDEYVRVDEA